MYKKIGLTSCVASAIGVAAVILLALLVVLTLSKPTHASPLNDDVSVDLDDNGFHAEVITISVGTKVVWENTSDTLTHTLVFTDGVMSEVIRPTHKYDRIFSVAGMRTYTDVSLPGKIGTIHIITGTPPSGGEGSDAELHIATTHEQPIATGATLDYRVRYENNSDGTDAQNVMITVTLPTSAALVSSLPMPMSQVSNTLVYSIGTLPAHTERRIDLKVKLPSPLPEGSEVAVKAVIAASNMGANSGDTSEDHSTVRSPKLSLGVRPAEESRLVAGGLVTYSLQYANHSDDVAADSVTVTMQLPPLVSFVSATRKDETNGMTLTQLSAGSVVSFYLGTLRPDSEGRILAQLRLSDALTSRQKISITAQIASAGFTASGNGGHDDGDDVISSTEHVVPAATDLYVRLVSSGDTEVGGTRTYRIAFGNAGLNAANNISLTVRFASALGSFDFGSTPPTRFISESNTAVWAIATLPGQTAAQPYEVKAKISSADVLMATATIGGNSASVDHDDRDNEDTEHIFVQRLTRPVIANPKHVIVGTAQTFVGTGLANAEVSVYLSGTATLPGHLLGTTIVGLDRVWVITPSQPITQVGWHWVTATQVLTSLVSPVGGASFVVSDSLHIDPASVMRDGIALGGLNAKLAWRSNVTYTLKMNITACNTPLTPTLQALFFNAQGLMSGYQNMSGTLQGNAVTFKFRPPPSTLFELYVDFYCPAAVTQTQPAPSPAFALAGVVHYHDCFDAPGCMPEPEDPPEHCEDCYVEKEDRPVARPIDPDGYVYDGASVRAGASITQSIITNAWVTVTRQSAPGLFSSWNALFFNQVNPQFSDSLYPDKVLVPGYYSFLVPPGAYRIRVVAPGFLPYESNTLVVQTTPVTLNVPLERTGTLTAVTAVTPSGQKKLVFLPMITR
jgi:plastocyanin